MGMALYSLLLMVGLAVCSPWWLARMVRYRDGVAQRLGRVPAELRAAAAGQKVVWVHAVSVGEVLAATRLVAELEATLGAGWVVVVSTTTSTGQALAKERFGDGCCGGWIYFWRRVRRTRGGWWRWARAWMLCGRLGI